MRCLGSGWNALRDRSRPRHGSFAKSRATTRAVICARFASARGVSLTSPSALLFPLLYLSLGRVSPPTGSLRHRQLSDSAQKTQTCLCFGPSLTPPTDSQTRPLCSRLRGEDLTKSRLLRWDWILRNLMVSCDWLVI